MDYILWNLPSLNIDQTPCLNIDKNTGEFIFEWEGDGNRYEDLPLLYCENGESVCEVNNWLVHLKVNNGRKQVNTQAQAMLHFYTFLRDKGIKWDVMPIAPRNRPTYLFRKHLKMVYKSGGLARSTAQNYIRVVVNFYKFYISKGYEFANPPFNNEVFKIKIGGRHDQMQNASIYVDTTDLRLKIPKEKTIGNATRRLMPLSEDEWDLVDNIYRVKGEAIRHSSGSELPVRISEEFKLILSLARFTGMRRQELVTFRASMVFRPSERQLQKKYLIDNDGVLIGPKNGVDTKGSGSRTIEFPTALMLALHKYINSKRYINRRKKFVLNNPADSQNPPLFISQNGNYYSGRTLDARWGEIRNSVRKIKQNFNHKFHNLRSTYAVYRLKRLLNAGVLESKALDYLEAVMGHKNRVTLLTYLRLCKVNSTANEIYENVADVLIDEDFSFDLGNN